MKTQAIQSAQIIEWTAPNADPRVTEPEPLRATVHRAIRTYLGHLDGHEASGLYQLVMDEVEQPLLAAVFEHARGNQTRAAAILGISRSTLRKKLTQYGLN